MEEIQDSEQKYIDEGDVEGRPKRLKEKIFEWCQKGDADHLKKYLNDPNTDLEDVDHNQWTPIIWAVVNGHVNVVKTILEKTHEIKQPESLSESQIAEEQAIEEQPEVKKPKSSINNSLFEEKTLEESFKKPNNQRNHKYTPLHWAAYKGNILISSLLIKAQFNPLEIDMYGNTSIHQAAASNVKDTFKMFMGLGLDLELKNARNHTPLDLCSNEEMKALIKKAINTKMCFMCQKYFSFFVTKFLCFICEEIICKECSVSNFYYLNSNEAKKELLECRCKTCSIKIDKEEAKLNSAIAKNSLEIIESAFKACEDMRINPKLRVQAIANIDRLQREQKIQSYIAGLENVTDHKTIEKSVHLLLEEAENAKNQNINIDPTLIEKLESQKNRKLAEKELRKMLMNLTVFDSSDYVKLEIEEKLNKAIETKVDEEFIIKGKELLEKVILHLKCMDVFNILFNYPKREYPAKDDNDKNKKKKKEAPPKKKKKKKDIFPKPEWSNSASLKQKVDEYVSYLKIREEIGFDEEFVLKSKELLTRMHMEIAFLKKEEEELAAIEAEKAKKLAKKKKK